MGRPAEIFLAHYGIKGMRWGFRTKDNGTVVKTGKRTADSDDHTEAQSLKKNKTSTLSNSELRKINERLQLEQTYAQLNTKAGERTAFGQGRKYAKNLLGMAKTGQEVYNVVNSPAAKAVRSIIENK